MKAAIYPKLATVGILKNKKLFYPYIFTCILSISMFYIMSYLSKSVYISSLYHGEVVIEIMTLGSYVIMAFSAIFLFYTNSFLIRRRKKEFGLYNILGMNKHNIGLIVFFEVLIIYAVSMVIGLLIGVLFSKLSELLLINIINSTVNFDFSVPVKSILEAVLFFGALFLLIFLNTYRAVRFSKPVELIKSENSGEKPPKANWFFGLIGLVILAVAYYFAVTITNPVDAMVIFFFAVIAVIVATYLLFISGSVLLCRILQKNKKYYYKKNHFISVSSMLYRMKRNGAGLASICILLTMVLVMISSTTCLFFGSEDGLNSRLPKDVCTSLHIESFGDRGDETMEQFKNIVYNSAEKNNVDIDDPQIYVESGVSGYIIGDGLFTLDENYPANFSYEDFITVHFLSLEDFRDNLKSPDEITENNVAVYVDNMKEIPTEFEISDIKFTVAETLSTLNIKERNLVFGNIYIIVPNISKTTEIFCEKLAEYGDRDIDPVLNFNFNTSASEEEQSAFLKNCEESINTLMETEETQILGYNYGLKAEERLSFYSMYGGFFFLGIMLSVVFIIAAVLIIYYKQISEGYEDYPRFTIMQNIGMTKRDIKKSINSQMLTVFFLPIVLSSLHLFFAFPMIEKLILLFDLKNTPLLLLTTALTLVIITVFYSIVYKVTSNSYYKIASGIKDN